MNKFYIVETNENSNRCCTAVPTNWVEETESNQSILYWPNKQFCGNKLRKNRVPPEKNWISIKCTVIARNIGEY